jgi:cytochrome d ubiquinol oxidase subunit II
MLKTVTRDGVSWFANYGAHPWLWLLPALAIVAALLSALLRRLPRIAFLCSCVVPGAVIATAGAALFPFLLPSSTNPGASLTVWDASSSKLTLGVMLGAVALLLPVIIAYTSWVYYVMRGPVTAKQVNDESHSY